VERDSWAEERWEEEVRGPAAVDEDWPGPDAEAEGGEPAREAGPDDEDAERL
jgi:hypothetical protein